MIITIDGPAGTGKSTVAQRVARELGFDFLDTGAMYRSVGLEALRQNIDLEDASQLERLTRDCHIEFNWSTQPPQILLNAQPVESLLRSPEVTRAASYIATVPAVRQLLVQQQQRIGHQRPNLVSEGRDQGSVVFPDAQRKFYLDATPHERAQRRVNQLRQQGKTADVDEVLRQILDRDERDRNRRAGPLVAAPGSTIIDTTHLSLQEVVQEITRMVRAL
ncbi:MAG: (d)CMP kinase [Phycisphaerales bacterium]|nr:(d)CMP kinase [Phycisphaerales bacterium]